MVVEVGERLVSPTKEGERVVEVGVFGLGLCSGEATWLVRWNYYNQPIIIIIIIIIMIMAGKDELFYQPIIIILTPRICDSSSSSS